MRSYARVFKLTKEYQELWERSRMMATGKVKRTQAALCSNQGYTYAEVAAQSRRRCRRQGNVEQGYPPRNTTYFFSKTESAFGQKQGWNQQDIKIARIPRSEHFHLVSYT